MYSDLMNIESYCQSICLALHVTEAQHMVLDSDERRKALVKLTIKSLKQLLDGGEVGGVPSRSREFDSGPGSPSNALALSLEPSAGSEALDRAADALSVRLGWVPPR